MDLEKKLILPVYDFLQEKKYSFKAFDKIGENNQTLFGSTHRQFKTEKWFQAELAVFLTRIGWTVGTELRIEKSSQKTDLCLRSSGDQEIDKLYIELKNYANTEQSARGIDFRQLKDDFEKIGQLEGLSLVLLPKNTRHDQQTNYTRKMYEKIFESYSDIKEVFSKAVHYDVVQDEGFWVTWWTFNLPTVTEVRELRDFVAN